MAVTRRRGSNQIVEDRRKGGSSTSSGFKKAESGILIWLSVMVGWYGWLSYWVTGGVMWNGVDKPWMLKISDLSWLRFGYNVMTKPVLRWEVALLVTGLTYLGWKVLGNLSIRIIKRLLTVKVERISSLEWVLEGRRPSLLREFVDGV